MISHCIGLPGDVAVDDSISPAKCISLCVLAELLSQQQLSLHGHKMQFSIVGNMPSWLRYCKAVCVNASCDLREYDAISLESGYYWGLKWSSDIGGIRPVPLPELSLLNLVWDLFVFNHAPSLYYEQAKEFFHEQECKLDRHFLPLSSSYFHCRYKVVAATNS